MITLIPWIGGKGKLIPTLQNMLPDDFIRFVDVFGGGGTVTFNLALPRNTQRIYNDLNADLANLMRVVKAAPLDFMDQLRFLPPHSRDEFNVLCDYLNTEEFTDEYLQRELDLADRYFDPPDAEIIKNLLRKNSKENPVVRAAAFYKVMRGSFSGTGDSYGARALNVRSFFYQIQRASDALQYVIVENRTYEEIVIQNDHRAALFYFDPPYYTTEKYYAASFGLADHYRLNELIKGLKGYCILSYNNCEFIRDLYKDFYIFLAKRQDSLSQKEGQMYEELIITNYDPREYVSQMSLLEQGSENCILINEPQTTTYLRRNAA